MPFFLTEDVSSDVKQKACCAVAKKIKKRKWLKSFSWVGEKNTLLKKLLVALACAFFKSGFFCALDFSFIVN